MVDEPIDELTCPKAFAPRVPSPPPIAELIFAADEPSQSTAPVAITRADDAAATVRPEHGRAPSRTLTALAVLGAVVGLAVASTFREEVRPPTPASRTGAARQVASAGDRARAEAAVPVAPRSSAAALTPSPRTMPPVGTGWFVRTGGRWPARDAATPPAASGTVVDDALAAAEAPAVDLPLEGSPVAEAPPAARVATFDPVAAAAAIERSSENAQACPGTDAGPRAVRVVVTFASSGRATQVVVADGFYMGTPTGGCIARALRAATVPPFEGDPVSVTKTVSVR